MGPRSCLGDRAEWALNMPVCSIADTRVSEVIRALFAERESYKKDSGMLGSALRWGSSWLTSGKSWGFPKAEIPKFGLGFRKLGGPF